MAHTDIPGLDSAVRRCYVDDATLQSAVERSGRLHHELIAMKLPDPGSVMSGDFGEILAAIFSATREYPAELVDPKKWRLKQDRTKAMSHSDVVQFELPEWPNPTPRDRVICAEVKTKATKGAFRPIPQALSDSKKDADGRLVKTLVWLRERATFDDLGTLTVDQLDRFINANEHPPAAREFMAVAVISSDLLAGELKDADTMVKDAASLIVLSVPSLKAGYEGVYALAVRSADAKPMVQP